MAREEKTGFVDRILNRQLGDFVNWIAPEQMPLLGQDYLNAMQTLIRKVDDFLSTHRMILLAQDLADLDSCYERDGSLKGESVQDYWKQIKSDSPVSYYTHEIYLAGLGRPDFLPDYAYWSRMEWFQIDEVLWLALGLNPAIKWSEALKDPKQRRKGRPVEFAHVTAVREQITRFAPGATMGINKFRGPELLEWIEKTEFPCHPEFVEMLRKVVERRGNADAPTDNSEPLDGKSLADPRAVVSVARIITAIAIKEYGYQPNSDRSPIPTEIQDIMDELGLEGSAKTVLKYLRVGSRDLPKEPKGKSN